MIFIDTNILVYAAVEQDIDKKALTSTVVIFDNCDVHIING
jgi:predicted nucleic acid-binding protein